MTQFQITARGRVQQEGGKQFLIAGKDRFEVLSAIDSPAIPPDTPVLIEAILWDKAAPMQVKVLTVKPVR